MEKKFDAVKFQRKIREELSEKYNIDRETFLKGNYTAYPSNNKIVSALDI